MKKNKKKQKNKIKMKIKVVERSFAPYGGTRQDRLCRVPEGDKLLLARGD
jgi:hypothetical protein